MPRLLYLSIKLPLHRDESPIEKGSIAEAPGRSTQLGRMVEIQIRRFAAHAEGGLARVYAAVAEFEKAGLGQKVKSWVSTGPNLPITFAEIKPDPKDYPGGYAKNDLGYGGTRRTAQIRQLDYSSDTPQGCVSRERRPIPRDATKASRKRQRCAIVSPRLQLQNAAGNSNVQVTPAAEKFSVLFPFSARGTICSMTT